ncbi:MAG: hypothetical protein AB1500_07960 [Bacillota bacterium]
MASSMAQQIEAILAPAIGPTIAKGAIIFLCNRLGIKPDQIDAQNLPKIAEDLKIALKMFGGEKMAASLADKIRRL